jgi:hypothetical protein
VSRGEPLDVTLRTVDLPFIGSSLKFRPPSIVPDKKKKKPMSSSSSLKIKKDDPFPELSQTFEKALSLIPQDLYPIVNSNECKRIVSAPLMLKALLQSTSGENPVFNEEIQALLVEDDLLRARLDAIKQKGISVLTELKIQSERLYNKLDEWLGNFV